MAFRNKSTEKHGWGLRGKQWANRRRRQNDRVETEQALRELTSETQHLGAYALTHGEAANALNLSAQQVRELISTGELERSDACPGGHLGVSLESVERYKWRRELLEEMRGLQDELMALQRLCGRYRSALRRIAARRRPDGTYNLGREACEQIAKDALAHETPVTDAWLADL